MIALREQSRGVFHHSCFRTGVWRCLRIDVSRLRHATLLFRAGGGRAGASAREEKRMFFNHGLSPAYAKATAGRRTALTNARPGRARTPAAPHIATPGRACAPRTPRLPTPAPRAIPPRRRRRAQPAPPQLSFYSSLSLSFVWCHLPCAPELARSLTRRRRKNAHQCGIVRTPLENPTLPLTSFMPHLISL